MKTSELIGAQLDWAVAKCEEKTYEDYRVEDGLLHALFCGAWLSHSYNPSTDWAQGGPIIERLDGFELKIWLESSPETRSEAHIHNHEGDWLAFGPTPLVAAMRCYVALKLGDEVEVPEELT